MEKDIMTEEVIENVEATEIEIDDVEQTDCDSNECCGKHDHKKDKKKHKRDLEEKVVELEQKLAESNDKFMRYYAETENFKKRLKDEQDRNRKYSAQMLITNVLPILDNFERATNVKEPTPELKNFLIGVEMIKNQLLEVLKSEGVVVIEALNQPFDPYVHQAVMQEAVEGVESGIVVEELQKGYKLHDRVIRPTMVKVSE